VDNEHDYADCGNSRLFGFEYRFQFHGHADANVPHTQVSVYDADSTLLAALLGRGIDVSFPIPILAVDSLFRSQHGLRGITTSVWPDMTHYALGRSVGFGPVL